MPNMSYYKNYQAEKPMDYSVLPAGRYNFIIAKIEDKTSYGGSEFTNLSLKVIDGNFAGRYAFSKLYWTEKTIGFSKWSVMKLLQVFDIDTRNIDVMTSIDVWNKCLLNKPFSAELKIKKQQGYEDQNELVFVSVQKVDNSAPVAPTTSAPTNNQPQYSQPQFDPSKYQNGINQNTAPANGKVNTPNDELPF